MKKTFVSTFVFVLLFALGLMTAQAGISVMVGTWTGTGRGVDSAGLYYDATMTMVVTGQDGRLFYGTLTAVISGGPTKVLPLSGVILVNKDVFITLGIDPDSGQPSGTFVAGKLTAKTLTAHWQNLGIGQTGECVLKKL
jgi:hypothetical protein